MQTEKKPSILFISHESSLSGAPLLLLSLIRLLKENGFSENAILVSRGGPIEHLFTEAAPTLILKPMNYQKDKGFFGKLADYVQYRLRLRKAKKWMASADLVFNNTIANGLLLKKLYAVHKPVITYVHELQEVMRFFEAKGDTQSSLTFSAAFFSPVRTVTDHLVQQYHIDPSKIFPLNYYFNWESFEHLNKAVAILGFRKKYDIPSHAFLIAGMGAGSFRKGTDLFVDIAGKVMLTENDIYFFWIGDFTEEEAKQVVLDKIRSYALEDRLRITGFLPPDPANLLPFDLLALTSREDPYPLVVIEAALIGIPAVCFNRSGGMVEFIGEDAGTVVPEGSVEQFAEAIIELKTNPKLLQDKARNAREKAKARHADPGIVLKQFQAGVETVLID